MSTLAEIRSMPKCVTALPGNRPVHESVLRSYNILRLVQDMLTDSLDEKEALSYSSLKLIVDIIDDLRNWDNDAGNAEAEVTRFNQALTEMKVILEAPSSDNTKVLQLRDLVHKTQPDPT